MKDLPKLEVEEEIEKIENSKLSPREIKKMKKLAMHYNIKLGTLRKNFCKKCFSTLEKSEVRIKKGRKIVKCGNCGFISRWRLK